jgi:hypothetical protein
VAAVAEEVEATGDEDSTEEGGEDDDEVEGLDR